MTGPKLDSETRSRLKVHERTPSGRIRNYIDPKSKTVFSARAVQTFSARGLSYEDRQVIEREGKTRELAKLTTRKKRTPPIKRGKRRGKRTRSYEIEHVDYLISRWQDRAAITGRRPGRAKVLSDPAFWQSLHDLRSRDRSPRGPKARALVRFGLRAPGELKPVGNSPKRRRPGVRSIRV